MGGPRGPSSAEHRSIAFHCDRRCPTEGVNLLSGARLPGSRLLTSLRRDASIRRTTALRLVRFGARHRLETITVGGLLLASRRVAGSPPPSRRDRAEAVTNIVSIGGSEINAAFESAFGEGGGSLWSIQGSMLKAIGEQFLPTPPHDFHQREHREAHPMQHRALVAFLARVIPRFLHVLKANLVAIGNFTPWMMPSLSDALIGSGRRLLVVHREGLISGWKSVAAEYATTMAEGVGVTSIPMIAVHSRATRDLIVGSGVAPDAMVVATGAIKLDACHAFRIETSNKEPRAFRRVTFFTFWPFIGIRLTMPSPEQLAEYRGPSWSKALEDTVEVAGRLADARPDVQVVVKSKKQVAKLPEVRSLLKSATLTQRKNIAVVSAGDGQDYIRSSDAIVALNSTVILEAIAAGTPVYVPAFGTTERPELRQHLLELGTSVRSVSSPEQLLQELCGFVDRPPLPRHAQLSPDEVEVLERYAGNTDGLAATRLARFIRSQEG